MVSNVIMCQTKSTPVLQCMGSRKSRIVHWFNKSPWKGPQLQSVVAKSPLTNKITKSAVKLVAGVQRCVIEARPRDSSAQVQAIAVVRGFAATACFLKASVPVRCAKARVRSMFCLAQVSVQTGTCVVPASTLLGCNRFLLGMQPTRLHS